MLALAASGGMDRGIEFRGRSARQRRPKHLGREFVMTVTAAELVVLGAVLALLVWLLRPLQRAVRNLIERWLLRGRHGRVIEGRFRAVPKEDPPEDPPSDGTH